MTRLCLFMICQVIIILLRTAWPGYDLPALWASLLSSLSLPHPALLTSSQPGPIHTGPDHGLCWVIHWSNQTGMTIQNVNKCNSCSRRTHSHGHLTRAAENGEKYTTRLFECACFPSVFASVSKLDLLRGEIHCPILTLQVILHSVNIVHFRVCFYLRAMTGLVAWHLIFGRKYSHRIALLLFVYITSGNINPFQ